MQSTAAVIVISLALMWMIQYYFTYKQMRRYYKRLNELKREGTVWVGLNGSAWKGRQYAVVVVDNEDRIVRVEQLSGWTVLAKLKPVPGFKGRPISDLTDDEVELPVKEKLILALRDAVKHMEAHAQKKLKEQAEAENSNLNYSCTQG